MLFIENLASHVIVLTSYLWKPVTLLKVLQFKYQAIVNDKSFNTRHIITNFPFNGTAESTPVLSNCIIFHIIVSLLSLFLTIFFGFS